MATITLTRGKTLPNSGVKADLHDLVDLTTATITGIVNADVGSSAAIAGTKISPNFGSQNVVTTGTLSAGATTLTSLDAGTTCEANAYTLAGVAADTAGGLGKYSTLVLKGIKDYGTSASSSTAKAQSALYMAYGTISISATSSQAITNLSFTSTATYSIVCIGDNGSATHMRAIINSASQATLYNDGAGTQVTKWIAIGT